MTELSQKAYRKIQEVAKLIYRESESQIKPRPIIITNTQLSGILPEATFADALGYLEENGLISYKYEKEYSAAYYDYDQKSKEAVCFNSLRQGETWESKIEEAKIYARQRDDEKKKGYLATFTITLHPAFTEKYNDIMATYGSYLENRESQPPQKTPITNFPLRLHCEAKSNVNDSSLQDISIFINNTEIRTVGPSVIGKIIQYAFSEAIPDSDIFTVIDIRKTNLKYTRNMSSLVGDFLDSDLLGKIFFEKIPRSKHSFKMRTEVSGDTIKELGFDTVSVLSEVERLAKKRRKNRGR